MPNGYGTVTFPQVVLQPGIPCDGGGGAATATAGCSSAAMVISVTSTIISISLQLPVAFVLRSFLLAAIVEPPQYIHPDIDHTNKLIKVERGKYSYALRMILYY
jgi:hypothetical protein